MSFSTAIKSEEVKLPPKKFYQFATSIFQTWTRPGGYSPNILPTSYDHS